MTELEIIQALEKLSYQVSIVSETIDYEKHPVEALILSKNWGPEEIEKVHDIFERWDSRLEQGDEMKSGSFEQEFKDALGIGYQGLKSIILAFYRNGQWTSVCEAYVDSFGDSPSLEFHGIMRRER